MRNSLGDPLTVTSNGAFTFAQSVSRGGSYAITIDTQPVGQTCTISSGVGKGLIKNITQVKVDCAAATYTVTVKVDAASPSGVPSSPSFVLTLNNSEVIHVDNDVLFTNGTNLTKTFVFNARVPDDGSYTLTVTPTNSGARGCQFLVDGIIPGTNIHSTIPTSSAQGTGVRANVVVDLNCEMLGLVN